MMFSKNDGYSLLRSIFKNIKGSFFSQNKNWNYWNKNPVYYLKEKILFIRKEKPSLFSNERNNLYSWRKKDEIFKKIQFFINIEFLFNSSSKIFKKIENLFILMFVNHLHQQTFKNLRLFIVEGKIYLFSKKKKSCLFSKEKNPVCEKITVNPSRNFDLSVKKEQ